MMTDNKIETGKQPENTAPSEQPAAAVDLHKAADAGQAEPPTAPESDTEPGTAVVGQAGPSPAADDADAQNRQYVFVCYLLYAAVIVGVFPMLVGVILAYVKRGDMQNPLYAGHLQYLINTFWIALFGAVVSTVLLLVVIGWLLWMILIIWLTYRLIYGFVRFMDNKPIETRSWI